MEVLPRAIAASSTVVSASSAPKESVGSTNKNAQVRGSSLPSVPFLRPASALIASIIASSTPAAWAVNYDDFVKRASETASSAASSDFSFPELPSIQLPSVQLPSADFDGATDFLTANPLALVVGFVAVAVPFIASRAFAGPGAAFGSVSAVEAYEKLSNPEQNTLLLDIRAPEDIKADGSPNLKSLKKTAVKVAYVADDDTFVDKVFAKCKNAEDSTLYILDRFDGSASNVAKLLANSGFKGAYAIKGGAEGQNGWQEKELPWTVPAKSFSLNIDGLKNFIKDGEGVNVDASGLVPTSLGVAAAAGVGLVVLSEAETTLQLLGTVALVQLFVKKFLFAVDRKKTVQDIKSFLDTKIAPKDLVDDVKEIGRVLLPKNGEVKAAVASGEMVLEKELRVDSVTPEALAEKAKEKLEEELGVEIPDLQAVKSDVERNVEAVASDLKSGAKELQLNAESVTDDLKSGAKDLQSNVEAATSDLKSSAKELQANAEEVASDIEAKTEEVSSDLKSNAKEASSDLESKAKDVGSDIESGAEEAKSTVESATEEVINSSNGSATPKAEVNTKEVTPFFESDAVATKKVTPFFESDAVATKEVTPSRADSSS